MKSIFSGTMTLVFIGFSLLVFCVSERGEADIHNLLRDLDSSDLEERGFPPNQDTGELNEYRKTLIKEEILKRLGLSSPPNISDSSFLPTHIIENVLFPRTTKDDQVTEDSNVYYGNTKQVVVMAEPDHPYNSNRPGRQFLRFYNNFHLRSISSVLLGFRRNPRVLSRQMLKKDGILLFRVLVGHSRSDHRPVHVIKTDHNWVIFNVTKEYLNFSIEENPVTNVTFELVCNVCGKRKFFWNFENNRPFLILNVKPSTHNRVARSTRCHGNNQKCCLVNYYVSFADIGWSDWIIAPRGIHFNYCKGTCSGLGPLRHRETLLMQRFSLGSVKSGPGHGRMDACCVVTKMASVSLLYKTGGGRFAIEKTDMPNIRAVECKCS